MAKTPAPIRKPVLSGTSSIRVPPDLWERFEPASRALNRSRNAQVRELIQRFVEEYEQQAAA